MEDQVLVQKYFDELMGYATKKVKKSTIRRIVALVVVLCLFFGLLGFLIGRASASDYPSGTYTLEDLLPEPLLTDAKGALESDLFSKVFVAYVSSGYWIIYFIPDTCEVCISSQNGRLGFSSSEGVYGWYQYYNGNVPVALTSQLPASSQGTFSEAGEEYLCTSWDRFYSFDWTCYCDTEMRMFGVFQTPNLVVRDNRYLACYESSVYGSPYIIVEASDSPQNLVSISFTYTDSLGTFGKTFLADELLYRPNMSPSAPSAFYFQIDPNDISTYRFTLNSCTYSAAGSYGSKTVSDLNLVFNEEDFPLPVGYDTITYIEHFNEALTGAGWVSGLTTVYVGYFDGYPLSKYYFDIDRSLVQPFSIRVLFLPDFLFSDQYPNAQEFSIQNYYSMFEQYDCIISGCEEDYFDEVYGIGSYDLVHNYRVTYNFDAALNKVMSLHEAAHVLPFEYVNDVPIVTQTQIDVGILYNRSFLLKQILYSFGDIDDRLLEFEVNLLGEDGVLSGLQEQWVLGYESSNNFYNVLLDKLADLGYAINGLNFDFSDSINQRLDRIIGYLDFDLEVDLSKLSEPWLDIFTFAKNMFEDSEPMWDSIGSGADVLYDGLPVSNQYDVEQLPAISGPIPLYPTIAPVPLIPTVSPTLIPLGGG